MQNDHQPVFVSVDAARMVFRWDEAIAALQAAYAEPLAPAATPPRTIASGTGGWLRALPAFPANSRCFGAKLMGMGTFADAPGAEYVIVLFDKHTSHIVAFVDAALVTGYRTAATSAAALDRLAPPGPARLAVLGSGLEASMHLRAIAAVRELTEVTVFSPTERSRQAFADTLGQELGIPIRALAGAEEGVRGADIVLAAARSAGERPILFGHWLRPSATVVSIGSTVPSQREIDASVVAACDVIVCDVVEEVAEETGDMIAATAAGIEFHHKICSIGQLMAGELRDRIEAAPVRMFKSVGAGLQDVIVAELVLDRALAAGLATPLPIRFENKLSKSKGRS